MNVRSPGKSPLVGLSICLSSPPQARVFEARQHKANVLITASGFHHDGGKRGVRRDPAKPESESQEAAKRSLRPTCRLIKSCVDFRSRLSIRTKTG